MDFANFFALFSHSSLFLSLALFISLILPWHFTQNSGARGCGGALVKPRRVCYNKPIKYLAALGRKTPCKAIAINTGFERHCWAEIDLDALRDNFAYVHRTAGRPVCAVVKADAYGHGAVAVARALYGAGAAGFAVSCLGEARHLRRHGITLPILVLGYTDPAFAAGLANQGITQAVFSPEYARALSAAAVAAGVSVSCHLKVDTGMGRIGFAVRGNFGAAVAALCECYELPG